MSYRTIRLVLVFGLVALLLPVSVFADRAVPGKNDRPDPAVRTPYERTAFPCDDPRQDLVLGVDEQLAFADVTAGSGVADRYACEPGWDESAPEHLYILRPSLDVVLDAWVLESDLAFDLILLSDCDTDSCLTMARSQISAELAGGQTYYLLVDSYSGIVGAYDLILETRSVGIPQTICEGGADSLGGITWSSPPGSWPGNLFAQPNLVSVDDCSDGAVRGGEAWFVAQLAPGVTLDVSVDVASPGSLDIALWIFDGCGPDAVCLAFANDGAGGHDEDLRYGNDDPEPVTLYLAVDCVRPPETELAGSYTMHFNGIVPVPATSLSDVRALFR